MSALTSGNDDFSDRDEYGFRYEDGPCYNSFPKFIRESLWPHWNLNVKWVESAGLSEYARIKSKLGHADNEHMLWREIGLAFPKDFGICQPISLKLSPYIRYQSRIIERCLHRLTELTTLNFDFLAVEKVPWPCGEEDVVLEYWFGLFKDVLPQIRHLIISKRSDYTDDLNRWLVKMPKLESLKVNYVSDGGHFGLELDSLTNLRQLYIRSSKLFDCYIPPLPNLVHLDLDASTDSMSVWLPNLAGMTALESLRLHAVADYGLLGQYLPNQLRSLSFSSRKMLPPESSRQLCLALQSYTNLTHLSEPPTPFNIRDRELQLQWLNWYANSAVKELKCHAENSGQDMIWPETIPPMKHLRSLDCSSYPNWASVVSQHTQLTWLSLHECTIEPLDILQRLNQLQQLYISEPVSAAFFKLVWPELTDLKVTLNSDDLVADFHGFLDNHPSLSQLHLTLGLQTVECYVACWKHVVQLPQLVKLTMRNIHGSAGKRWMKLDSINPNLREIRRVGYGAVVLPDYHELDTFDQLQFERNQKKHQTLRGLLTEVHDGWGFEYVRHNHD